MPEALMVGQDQTVINSSNCLISNHNVCMRKSIFLLSLLSLGLGACNNEYEEAGKNNVSMSFNVTGHLGAPETRMSYEGNSDDELKIKWENNPTADIIGLFNDGTSQNGMSTNEQSQVVTANGNTATFSDVTLQWATQPSGPVSIYAYYPYQAGATNMKAVEINLTEQKVMSTTEPLAHLGKYDFMAATTQVNVTGNSITTSGDNELDLHFQHLLHLMTFKISGVSSTELGELTSLTFADMSFNGLIFYTKGNVDLTNPSYPIQTFGTNSSGLTFSLNNLVVDDVTDVLYLNLLVIPVERYKISSCMITLRGTKGKKKINKTLSPAFKVERGKHSLFNCTSGWQDVTN